MGSLHRGAYCLSSIFETPEPIEKEICLGEENFCPHLIEVILPKRMEREHLALKMFWKCLRIV